ncbi:MAG: hypothetical protein RLZZ118_1415 [Bacteroidota bacterium]|jgi:para-aminobenzoate synthetase component 1
MKDFVQKMNELGKKREAFFFTISFDTTNYWIGSAEEAFNHQILFSFPNNKNHSLENTNQQINLAISPIAYNNFQKSFNTVMQEIEYGNSFLCNLTASTPIATNADLQTIFTTAKAKYKIYFKNQWTCFSPESFIQINNNCISTYPMKGTIDASITDAEKTILQDPKETAEHYTIVDLLRNDLSSIAENVVVEKFRYTDKIETQHKTLLQISSSIKGEMPENWQNNIGSLLEKLLPAGSISGAPKKKTIEIINAAETHYRGYYTGIAGYFDGENIDTCVLIRLIENTNNGLIYKSGGGITCNSNPILEYQELIQKIYIPT